MPTTFDAPPTQSFTRHTVNPARLADYDIGDEATVDVAGSLEAARTVAIVGSRQPTPEASSYAYELAASLALRGAVIVSGGAVGIDKAAHEGAMSVGGRTWSVLASSCPVVTPKENTALFNEIVATGGTVVWNGFGRLIPHHFLRRNELLVALSDAVIVVQARVQSGSRNAAKAARELRRPLWIVPPSPWLDREAYAGNVIELTKLKGRPLYDEQLLHDSLHLAVEPAPQAPQLPLLPPLREDKAELAIIRVLHDAGSAVLHIDEIIRQTSLPYGATASALLTLCLEAVVVEGPGGFYRRRPAPLAAMG